MSKVNKKSLFISKTIRPLKLNEGLFLKEILDLMDFKVDKATISYVPPYVSDDNKLRPLLMSKDIYRKIKNKHGILIPENLIITGNEFDYVLKNVDKIKDKINLIKKLPNSENFLLIAAIRNNGYFVLTHFETESLRGNELKSLLGRGELVSKDSRPGSLSLSTETTCQPKGVCGVIDN